MGPSTFNIEMELFLKINKAIYVCDMYGWCR